MMCRKPAFGSASARLIGNAAPITGQPPEDPPDISPGAPPEAPPDQPPEAPPETPEETPPAGPQEIPADFPPEIRGGATPSTLG